MSDGMLNQARARCNRVRRLRGPAEQPPFDIRCVAVSHREQPVEEVAVTPQGETEVFGGGLFATGPLILEPCTRFGEAVREPVDQIGHQAIRFMDALFGIVDESRLHIVPARAKTRELVVGEQRSLSG